MIRNHQSARYHRAGYVSLLATLSLTLLLIAFAMSAYRETRQAQQVQTVTQVKVDFEQKERAFLRALLHLVPNAAMQAMQLNSANNTANLGWDGIFTQALQEANIGQALDPATISTLGISATAISANTSDAAVSTTNSYVTSPDGSGNFVLPSTKPSSFPMGLTLPGSLEWDGTVAGSSASDRIYPSVGFHKRLLGQTVNQQFSLIDYPNISFGYQDQNSQFIAKRNWWAFTLDLAATTAAVSGIRSNPKTFVLSIYEVPSQLALSSAGFTTELGRFGDAANTDWGSNINITGPVYAQRAQIENTNLVGSVASREGIVLGSSAPSGQVIGGLNERRLNQATTSISAFSPFSTSSDSGLVSFTPINRGFDFYDYFVDTTEGNRLNTSTAWSDYTVGARSCALSFEICQLEFTANNVAGRASNARRLIVSPTFATSTTNPDGRRPYRTSRGFAWYRPGESGNRGTPWAKTPSGDDWPLQANDVDPTVLPDGRRFLTLDLEKLPNFLSVAGASDVTVNNTIWIGPRYNDPGDLRYTSPGSNNFNNNNIPPANFPSTNEDFALIIKKSGDLSAYTNGLTIVTPFRIYFADDFNTTPVTPPAGASAPWYPPVAIYAPEKRFGILNTAGTVSVVGQVGYTPSLNAGANINPLDLKDGSNDTATPSDISADLTSINRLADLPPISSMSWMTTIEEIKQ